MFHWKLSYPFFALFILLGLRGQLTAQIVCTPTFVNEYKRTNKDSVHINALKALADGTILIAGSAPRNGGGAYQGFVSRLAADGTPQWSYIIGGSNNDDINGITSLNDGSFLLYGSTASFGHTEGKGWLVDIDGTGTVLWSRQIGSSVTSKDVIKATQQFADGDIIGTFNTNDSSAASDPIVFKMGLDGAIRWMHRFDNGPPIIYWPERGELVRPSGSWQHNISESAPHSYFVL